jgi:DNA-binding transcriptional ArsR family regulator
MDRIGLARLLAEPARAEICAALLGGEALSAGELARSSGIAPSTTSEHLSRMASAGLVTVVPQGRHRYYRLASPEVAELVEYLVSGAAPRRVRSLSEERRQAHLKVARTCYDHLAGVVAVQLAEALVDAGAVGNDEGALHATEYTVSFLADRGVNLTEARERRRPLVRGCLDWTERRPHLAGRSGAAILQHLLDTGAMRRKNGTRAVHLTETGMSYLEETFGLVLR